MEKLQKQLVQTYGVDHDDARFGLQLAKMRLGNDFGSTDKESLLEMAYGFVVETSPKKYGKKGEEEEEKKEIEAADEGEDTMIGDINEATMLVDPQTAPQQKRFLPSQEEKAEELEYDLPYPTISTDPVCLQIVNNKALNMPRDVVPVDLAAFGVTPTEWTQIWDSMNDHGWAKAWKDTEKFDNATLDLVSEDARVSVKGLAMVMAGSQAMVGLSTHAANSLALANSLLNPFRITVQLKTQARQIGLPCYEECDGSYCKPIGLVMTINGAPQARRRSSLKVTISGTTTKTGLGKAGRANRSASLNKAAAISAKARYTMTQRSSNKQLATQDIWDEYEEVVEM